MHSDIKNYWKQPLKDNGIFNLMRRTLSRAEIAINSQKVHDSDVCLSITSDPSDRLVIIDYIKIAHTR